MQPARLTPVAALAAACAGAAAWASLGTQALSEPGARAVRVGLLPPLWWLVAFVAGAVALAWSVRLSSDRAKPLFFSAALLLPWLPMRLPAALLLWSGPIAWLVWASIAAAVVAAGGVPEKRLPRVRAILANPARAPWVAFVCAAVVYNAAAWRLAPLVPSGDEPHYLIIAQSLWRDGDLRIENNHQRGDYREYFGGELRPDFLRRGTDGQIYSIHLPGLSVIIAPVFALGGYGLVKVFLAVMSAAATAVAWRTAYVVTARAAAAWFGWAAVALAAPFLLLSFMAYPDGPGAAVVMLAFAMIAAPHPRRARSAWWWAAAGVLPALLPWLHPRFSVLAASLGLILAGRALRDARPVRALAGVILVPAASAAGWFGYYYAIYGEFNPAVAYGYSTQMSAGRVPTGVLGLLFDQQYGLFVYAPVFAIGAAGLAIEWAAIVVPYGIATAMYHMWWGGYSSPARFIGATLLLFAVPLAAAWASATQVTTRTVQAVAFAISAGMSAGLLAVERGGFVLHVRDIAAPWFTWASQMADLTRALPSLFRNGPLRTLAEVAVWTAALFAAWMAARFAARSRSLAPGSSALAAVCAIGLAATVAAEATWRIEGVSGVRTTYGQLRVLEALGTPRAASGVILDSHATMRPGHAVERLRVGAEPAAGTPDDSWLSLPFLPAGRYQLCVDFSAAVEVDASVVAGRSDGALEAWHIVNEGAGALSRELVLPVGVSGVRVAGDAGARAAVHSVWIQPVLATRWPPPISRERAASARRYGRVAVFALDHVYLEPGGMWTAGRRTAELVVQVDPGRDRAVFTMRGGPEATPVRITAGTFSLEAELAPGEEREVAIPVTPAGAALVTIRADRGFRPAEVDRSSTDTRLLGVRLEPRSP